MNMFRNAKMVTFMTKKASNVYYGVPLGAWVANFVLTLVVALVTAYGVQVRHSVQIDILQHEVAALRSSSTEYLKSISEMATDIKYIKEHLTYK